VDHAARHWDRVLEHFFGDAELLERVNAARRERKVDGSPTDRVAFARIGPPLAKLDLVPAPTEIRRQQSAREPAPN